MAHCPPELLDDLAGLFAEIRTWPGVTEKSRGVFYVSRTPFLHFHRQADGRRRADVKGPGGWRPFILPHPISASRQGAFVRTLRTQYASARGSPIGTAAGRRASGGRAASTVDPGSRT